MFFSSFSSPATPETRFALFPERAFTERATSSRLHKHNTLSLPFSLFRGSPRVQIVSVANSFCVNYPDPITCVDPFARNGDIFTRADTLRGACTSAFLFSFFPAISPPRVTAATDCLASLRLCSLRKPIDTTRSVKRARVTTQLSGKVSV